MNKNYFGCENAASATAKIIATCDGVSSTYYFGNVTRSIEWLKSSQDDDIKYNVSCLMEYRIFFRSIRNKNKWLEYDTEYAKEFAKDYAEYVQF